MHLIVDRALSAGPDLALRKLVRALNMRGEDAHRLDSPGKVPALLIGLAGYSEVVDSALAKAGFQCPDAPESVLLSPLPSNSFLISGSDERGLIYALLEAARAVEVAPDAAAEKDPAGHPSISILDSIPTEIGSPHLNWRSMQLFLCNRELEREWFYSEAYWVKYLDQLALYRYNNMSLTFGHQIAYMSPPYPFLLELPEFPQVRALDSTPEERRDSLNMLRVISANARVRGLHFTLGVWSQHAHEYGEPMVEGLTPDILAEYNAAGLARLLAECPEIDGVQFRMNVESGVDEENQAEFYEPQFRAIADCGRPIRLDLRAKGLADGTIALAQRMIPNSTVVSTKHWCEHLGMPYSMPIIQQRDHRSYRRYGTWDLLRKPRTFPLIHRLWSAGSQRVLLWGDPEWVKRFVNSCSSNGDGFEVMAPLTNKGVRDRQPDWLTYRRSAFPYHTDETERFFLFNLLFGRLGYDPDAAPDLWRRELRNRFGGAAGAVDRLYSVGSQILPLLTTVLQMSASLWTFWPERYAGRSLAEDARVEPSDPTRFYRIDEYVEDFLERRPCGKWTPLQVGNLLRELAENTRLAAAGIEQTSTELRYTCLDFAILSELAEYHSLRIEAVTYMELSRRTQEAGYLPAVHGRLEQSRVHWNELAAVADGNYADDLVFGFREKGHCGHWKDDLAVVERDLAEVRRLMGETGEAVPIRIEWPGGSFHPPAPEVQFKPPTHADVREVFPLQLKLHRTEERSLRSVRCFHRIAHQALEFDEVEMQAGERYFVTAIPGRAIDAAWDLMLFFEFEFNDGSLTRWPDWRSGAPYFVIPTH